MTGLAPTSRATVPRRFRVRRGGRRRLRCSATKKSAKLQLAISMNSTQIHSSSGERKCPKLASCVDRPPRLIVANMCAQASTQLMPPSL